MPQRLATATDWSDYLKKYNKDVSGISDWEKYFLEPTKQYYQTQAQAVSAQTEYDISGAYQNYLRTQRSLLQNQQLASGFKEQLGEEAKSAYESAYATAKTKEAASLYDVSKAYTEALAKEDERLLGIGEQLASFEEKLYEFANIDSAYATMAYGQEQKDEAGKVIGTGLGHYEMNPETGEYTLSDRGKAFIQDLLYGETRVGSNSFESYLTDQEETELLDFYRQNQDLINEVFGLEAGQRAPDASLIQKIKTQNISDITTSQLFKNRIAAGYSITDSDIAKTQTYSGYAGKATVEHKTNTKDPRSSGTIITIDDKQYYSPKNKPAATTLILNVETRNKIFGAFENNDVFELNGKLYLVTKDFYGNQIWELEEKE